MGITFRLEGGYLHRDGDDMDEMCFWGFYLLGASGASIARKSLKCCHRLAILI